MSGNYPELKRAESLIKETLKMEEEKFLVLLDRGIKILNDEISKIDKVFQEMLLLNYMIPMVFH